MFIIKIMSKLRFLSWGLILGYSSVLLASDTLEKEQPIPSLSTLAHRVVCNNPQYTVDQLGELPNSLLSNVLQDVPQPYLIQLSRAAKGSPHEERICNSWNSRTYTVPSDEEVRNNILRNLKPLNLKEMLKLDQLFHHKKGQEIWFHIQVIKEQNFPQISFHGVELNQHYLWNLKNINNLQLLDLSQTRTKVEWLSDLQNIPTLTSLDLSQNSLCFTPSFGCVFPFLKDLKLKSLIIFEGENYTAPFSHMVKVFPNIQSLDLTGTHWLDVHKTSLQELKGFSSLATLDISDCHLTAQQIPYVTNIQSLTSLNISGNEIPMEIEEFNPLNMKNLLLLNWGEGWFSTK